jgi:hypothetical protein
MTQAQDPDRPIQTFVHSAEGPDDSGPRPMPTDLPPLMPEEPEFPGRDVFPDPVDGPLGGDEPEVDIPPPEPSEIEIPDPVEVPFDEEDPAEDIVPLDHPETPEEVPYRDPDPDLRERLVLRD